MKNAKRFIIFALCLLFAAVSLTAQQGVDATQIGRDAAQQKLREISVTKFEDAGFWYAAISTDDGLATIRRFEGAPADKEPLEGEAEANIKERDKYVVGMKIRFYFRGPKTFALYPVRPLPIEGICKTISLWVVGRNYNHVLKILIEDQYGGRAEVTMGKLNFSGWKKLTVAIPPSLRQQDFHFSTQAGIKVLGFIVETDPAESYGSYYIYFDDLRAVTDLFPEESRDIDDMVDSW